jgi:hypothetical protein
MEGYHVFLLLTTDKTDYRKLEVAEYCAVKIGRKRLITLYVKRHDKIVRGILHLPKKSSAGEDVITLKQG